MQNKSPMDLIRAHERSEMGTEGPTIPANMQPERFLMMGKSINDFTREIYEAPERNAYHVFRNDAGAFREEFSDMLDALAHSGGRLTCATNMTKKEMKAYFKHDIIHKLRRVSMPIEMGKNF